MNRESLNSSNIIVLGTTVLLEKQKYERDPSEFLLGPIQRSAWRIHGPDSIEIVSRVGRFLFFL